MRTFYCILCVICVTAVSNCFISQGSVATYLRCGGTYYTRFVGNFFFFTAVQEFLKSVKI